MTWVTWIEDRLERWWQGKTAAQPFSLEVTPPYMRIIYRGSGSDLATDVAAILDAAPIEHRRFVEEFAVKSRLVKPAIEERDGKLFLTGFLDDQTQRRLKKPKPRRPRDTLVKLAASGPTKARTASKEMASPKASPASSRQRAAAVSRRRRDTAAPKDFLRSDRLEQAAIVGTKLERAAKRDGKARMTKANKS